MAIVDTDKLSPALQALIYLELENKEIKLELAQVKQTLAGVYELD